MFGKAFLIFITIAAFILVGSYIFLLVNLFVNWDRIPIPIIASSLLLLPIDIGLYIYVVTDMYKDDKETLRSIFGRRKGNE